MFRVFTIWDLFLHHMVILIFFVDYVTKWIESIPTKSVDKKTYIKMVQDVIFPRFGIPRYWLMELLISLMVLIEMF